MRFWQNRSPVRACSYERGQGTVHEHITVPLFYHIQTIHEKGAFTEPQLQKIERLAAEGFPYADTVLMRCYTGFRITEFLILTPASYDAKADALRGGIKTAAGKNRIVPVHPKIKPYLTARLKNGGERIICTPDGKPFNAPSDRKSVFKSIMQQIGAKNATPHWCRHTFASRLHTAGAPELDIKRLMGHADKDITEHYTHIDTEHLRKAVYLLQSFCN